MFACRDATDLMTDEREQALSGWVHVVYRLHMIVCPYCRNCREQLVETLELAQEIAAEPVPESTEESALAAFRARARTAPK